jgi:hypothetical protein
VAALSVKTLHRPRAEAGTAWETGLSETGPLRGNSPDLAKFSGALPTACGADYFGSSVPDCANVARTKSVGKSRVDCRNFAIFGFRQLPASLIRQHGADGFAHKSLIIDYEDLSQVA